MSELNSKNVNKISIPSAIFCPKCGKPIFLKKVTDTKTMLKLEEANYAAASRGLCNCGVAAILTIKRMPESPTFTLMFNTYRVEGGEK